MREIIRAITSIGPFLIQVIFTKKKKPVEKPASDEQ